MNISKRLRFMAGFTMVELMIVIAIIGIISVAVLSAINPLEQINKGKDTRYRSDASELLSALERYYANEEEYPWGVASANEQISMSADVVASSLVAQSELKAAFTNRVGSGKGQSDLTLYRGSTDTDIFVCFEPSSAQFLREASEKFASWTGSKPGAITSSTYCMP